MSSALAAVGAVLAAVLNLTLAPFLEIGRAQPDFVLVLAVAWTMLIGIDGGLIVAFVGGLMTDLLSPRPLGSTAFSLLLAVGGVAVAARFVVRGRALAAIAAVFVVSLVEPLVLRALVGALQGGLALDNPLDLVLPSAIYNTALSLLVVPLVLATSRRLGDRDRVGR